MLELYRDKDRASAEVRAMASIHIKAIHQKIEVLKEMENTLADLIHRCAGDSRPDCPILSGLAQD